MSPSDFFADQPAHVLWAIAGVGCLSIGMLAAEPTLSALGIAAFITAIISLSLKGLGLQLLIWGILSTALAIVFRGLVPKQSKDLSPARDAEVARTIPPGGMGEVTYEGSLWTARCQISDVTILKGNTVHVVGRQGNTLIVLPTTFSDEEIGDRKSFED